MKIPVERYLYAGLTDQAAAALNDFVRRSGLRETDAVNVAISMANMVHDELGPEGELLVRLPGRPKYRLIIEGFGSQERPE